MSTKTYRQWLSPANSESPKSFVLVEIDEDRTDYGDHELALGDCSKNITIYFSSSKKKRKAALAKLTKIQEALNILWGVLKEDE